MKLIKSLLEGWEPEKRTVNGDVTKSKYTGFADTLGDFTKAIKRLPDSIESISIPIDTSPYKSSSNMKKITPQGDWKEEVINHIADLSKQVQDDGQTIEGYSIKSMTPDKFTVLIHSDKSEKFADDMSKGKHGSLD